jgi:hypothetical protein
VRARTVLAAAFILPIALPARAAIEGEGVTRQMRAVRARTAPAIDGRLDDPAWAEASGASDFSQIYPDEGAAPTERTEVRVAYDDAALYFAIRCYDRDVSSLARSVARRDAMPESDSVTVSIDSSHDHATARSFTVNAAGVLEDQLLYNDTEKTRDWDAVWRAAAGSDGEGWTAELAIPLRVLPHRSGAEPWGINVTRNLFRRKELSSWIFTPRARSGVVSRFGHLVALGAVPAPRSLELTPYAATRAKPAEGGYDASAGLDVRYGVTPSLELEATLNPDFGQVEADPAVLNLTTFETFYPEKRGFFLEGSQLFQSPVATQDMQLFYSRRVGRAPSAPELANGEELLREVEPATIAGAAKLTGHLARGWEVAALEAVTLPVDVDVRSATETKARTIAPLTNYGVLRLRRELARGSVGGTFTSVRPFDSGVSSCTEGGAPVSARCASGSETAGIDWLLRPAGLLIAGQLVASRMATGANRVLRGGVTLRPGDVGVGGQLKIAREDGDNVLFSATLSYVSPRLDLNDGGYLERQNLVWQKARLTLRTLKPGRLAREGDVFLEVGARQTAAGTSLERQLVLGADLGLRNFWWTGLTATVQPSSWDDRELGDGTLLWRPPLATARYWLDTDGRKPVYFEGAAWITRGFDETWGPVRAWGADAGFTLRPAPRYDASIALSFSRTQEAARLVALVEDGYGLAPLDTRSVSIAVRQNLAFSPRLTLQTWGQIFFASSAQAEGFVAARGGRIGREELEPGGNPPGPWFHEALLNLTAVLRWEFSPGSAAYLVYQRSQSASEDAVTGIALRRDLAALGDGTAVDVAMLKIGWWIGT